MDDRLIVFGVIEGIQDLIFGQPDIDGIKDRTQHGNSKIAF